MATPERKPGSDLGRPAIDWNSAFAFYASLPPDRRTIPLRDVHELMHGMALRPLEAARKSGGEAVRPAGLVPDRCQCASLSYGSRSTSYAWVRFWQECQPAPEM